VRERQEIIEGLVRREEERFESTLDAGMNRLDDLLDDARKKQVRVLDGEEFFACMKLMVSRAS
jgi:alanyl-tRNA synthetase